MDRIQWNDVTQKDLDAVIPFLTVNQALDTDSESEN
jgi:hypothetical protein